MTKQTFKEDWPTPAEAFTNKYIRKTGKNVPVERHKNRQQLQNLTEPTMDIRFLQPSVVYPTQNQDLLYPTLDIHSWSSTLEEAIGVGRDMHPAIVSQLKPCKTKDDHNCLYNAICLCLGIPESQQMVVREKTALCLQENANHFENLLKASDEITLQTLIEQCKQPFCYEGWGNEFHILALAIMLKRNIIVYQSFKGPNGQFYQRKNKNIVGLSEEFRQGGDKIEQHMNFEPQNGIRSHNPIFIHLSGRHFTALIPRLPHPIYCVPPATNLPSIPNNGINVNLQDSSQGCRKMTRKARWLASKTPAQLAEYKEREKAKRKERKPTQEVAECEQEMDIVKESSEQGTKRKCVVNESDGKYQKEKKEAIQSTNVLPFTAERNIETSTDNFLSRGVAKVSKAETNKRYYDKNKDKIKAARKRKYNDPVNNAAELAKRKAAYRDPVKHAVELSQSKAAYAVPEKCMAKLAAKRQAYRNPVKHAAELAQKKAAYAVPEKRMAKLAAKRQAYKNPVKQAAELSKRKAAYRDPVKREAELAKKKAAYAVPEKRMAKLAAKREAYRNPVKQAAELAKKKAAYNVPENRIAKLKGKRKFNENPVNRELILAKRRILYKKQLMKVSKKTKTSASKVQNKSDYAHLLSQARKAMLELPVLACTVCHRARFKEQVKLCHRNKYPQSTLVQKCFTGTYMHKCTPNCSDSTTYHNKKKKEWICHTCDRHLQKGNMPPQAAINNLWLDDIPEELKTLNPLEMHLVSIVQPFMKIVPLPRGGQKGVRGQMVCVPANLQRTACVDVPSSQTSGNY